jgi:hypothetical protein
VLTSDYSNILDFARIDITNRQGSFLTGLARKRKGWLHLMDFLCMKTRCLPYCRIVFRDQQAGWGYAYGEFWDGAVFQNAMNRHYP